MSVIGVIGEALAGGAIGFSIAALVYSLPTTHLPIVAFVGVAGVVLAFTGAAS